MGMTDPRDLLLDDMAKALDLIAERGLCGYFDYPEVKQMDEALSRYKAWKEKK
jgi:hypothetical protein